MKVKANNAKYRVHWVMCCANAAKTKTYCIYEGPSEAAIRQALPDPAHLVLLYFLLTSYLGYLRRRRTGSRRRVRRANNWS